MIFSSEWANEQEKGASEPGSLLSPPEELPLWLVTLYRAPRVGTWKASFKVLLPVDGEAAHLVALFRYYVSFCVFTN